MSRIHRADEILGLTSEQREVIQRNVEAARRDSALLDARSRGAVQVPMHWPRPGGERWLPQTSAYIATAYLRLPRLQFPAMRFSDALAMQRSLAPSPVLDARDLAAEHELATWRARTTTVQPHPVPAPVDLDTGMPLAIVTATNTGRAQHRTTHVARLGDVVEGDAHACVDDAYAAARHLLATGASSVPLALVRQPGGSVAIAEVALPTALGAGAVTDPLVGSIAGSRTSLAWSRTATALAAVVGLDGVRWL